MYEVITSVEHWSEKNHQETQREPRRAEEAWQEANIWKTLGEKSMSLKSREEASERVSPDENLSLKGDDR